MKKLLALLSLAVALCASASAADASPAILAQSTKNGVTTLITTGRVQAEAAVNADGTVTFQIFPTITLLDSAGQVVSTRLDTSGVINVPLSAELVAKVLAEVKAAYDADQAAKAEAAATTAKSASVPQSLNPSP
jgi:TRAP-type C4-dicarboxylate transport system substrate-binding protein